MEHLWVLLALSSAFSLATSDALMKKALHGANEYLVAWARLILTLPVLLGIAFFIPVPQLDAAFYLAFLIALPVELVAIVLYVKALKVSPMSLTLPFLALTPVFLIVMSYFLLGEQVSFQGGAGIVLIASGSYVLNLDSLREGILGPFRAVLRERGSILMIGVALLYSVTSSLGKMAIEHSSPLFFGASYYFALTALFAPLALWMGKGGMRSFASDMQFRTLFLAGLFNAVMVVTHMTAIKLAKVAYMISVKRTSLLMGVLYGYLLFREENISGRFLGALLMFAGFVLVVTAR